MRGESARIHSTVPHNKAYLRGPGQYSRVSIDCKGKHTLSNASHSRFKTIEYLNYQQQTETEWPNQEGEHVYWER